MSDIERELGLTREGLVRLALLLGSDYTEGCQGEWRGRVSSAFDWNDDTWSFMLCVCKTCPLPHPQLPTPPHSNPTPLKPYPTPPHPTPLKPLHQTGVGIVNAVEVVHAFPGMEGFQRFRQWVESPDVQGALRQAAKAKASRRKPAAGGAGGRGRLGKGRGRKGRGAAEQSEEEQTEEETEEEEGGDDGGGDDDEEEVDGLTRDQRGFFAAHRGVRRNWQVPGSFPSPTVVSAYLDPRVDPNKARFVFGQPDHERLREYCW